MKKRIKINGTIIFFCVLLIFIFPKVFLRLTNNIFDIFAASMGFIFILLGFLLRISARGFKSEYSRSGHALVNDGPYSMVRNPMYLGIIGIAFGVIMLLFKWWAAMIFIAFFNIRYARLILKEEEILENNFGKEYSEYKNRVPRLFPKISANISGHLPLKWQWVKKEANGIVAMLAVIIILKIILSKVL